MFSYTQQVPRGSMIARFQNTDTEIKGSLCYWDTWPIAGKWGGPGKDAKYTKALHRVQGGPRATMISR